MIFTLGINFIEEFLLHVVELSLAFSLSLVLCISFKQLFSEHGVELLGEGLYSQSNLFTKVVARVFAVWPGDKLLNWHDLCWSWLKFFLSLWDDRFTE